MSTQFQRRGGAARRLARRVALVVPPTLGPSRWVGFVVRTRLRTAGALVESDPARMLRLVEPVAERATDGGATWRFVAVARQRTGDDAGAFEAVERAIDAGERTVTTLVMRRRLALRLERADDAEESRQLLLDTPPRSVKEFGRAVDALAGADLDLLERYDAMVSALPRLREASREKFDELLDEARLVRAHEAGPHAFKPELARVLATSGRPLRTVVQALVRRRAWHEVAVFVATTPHNSPQIGPRGARAGFPLAEVGKAASLALAAGHATAASIMAAKALVVRPDNTGFRATFDDARDQLTIARKGWTLPVKAESAPYEPAPRAVLSVLSQSVPLESGGYAARSHGVITALAAQGWDMRAVTRLGYPYDRWSSADTTVVPDVDHVDGIPYHRLLDNGVRRYPQVPIASYIERFEAGVRDLAVQHRARLIHASSYVGGLAGLADARRFGLPFVYEMSGLAELTEASRDPAFEGSDRHRFLSRLETGVARQADRCLVITEALSREMARRGVPEDRIVVVPDGVHVDRFRPAERDGALEADLGLAGKTVIGYVGDLVDHEGLDVLLDAIASLKETRDDVHVIIVGDGPSEQAVRAQVDRLRLGDMVTSTGQVPHEQVPRYLSLVDVVSFPRLPLPVCELISPIAAVESMAMGKAIIVSDVAALTEFVQDGVTGRVFRKGDADHLRHVLEQLLDEPDQRRRLGEAARQWVVRERDWASIAAVVEAAYTEILAGSATPVH